MACLKTGGRWPSTEIEYEIRKSSYIAALKLKYPKSGLTRVELDRKTYASRIEERYQNQVLREIDQAIAYINSLGIVSLKKKRRSTTRYFYFEYTKEPCSTYAGYSSARPAHSLTCGVFDNVDPQYSLIHELGHVLGLVHEQNRDDRDEYVTVCWQHIQPSHRKNFTQGNFETCGSDYEYNSTMHYDEQSYSSDRWSEGWKLLVGYVHQGEPGFFRYHPKTGEYQFLLLSVPGQYGSIKYDNVGFKIKSEGIFDKEFDQAFTFNMGRKRYLVLSSTKRLKYIRVNVTDIVNPVIEIRGSNMDKAVAYLPYTVNNQPYFISHIRSDIYYSKLHPSSNSHDFIDVAMELRDYRVTHCVPYTFNGLQYFIRYSSKTGDYEFCRLLENDVGVANVLARGKWEKNWSSLVHLKIGTKQCILRYNKISGVIEVCSIGRDRKSVHVEWRYAWTNGWDSFVPYWSNAQRMIVSKSGNGAFMNLLFTAADRAPTILWRDGEPAMTAKPRPIFTNPPSYYYPTLGGQTRFSPETIAALRAYYA